MLGKPETVEAMPSVVDPCGRLDLFGDRLAEFAVVDEVDAGVELAGNNVVDVRLEALVKVSAA